MPDKKMKDAMSTIKKPIRKKTFRPVLMPRYLPGSVDRITILKDLETYNKHLYQLHNASARIDAKPPKYHPLKFLKMIKIHIGMGRIREIDLENKDLLKKINVINRTKGFTDTWNPLAYANMSNWRLRETDFKRISVENKNFYHRLMHVKSQYPKEELDEFYSEMEGQMKRFRNYPLYKITTKDDELRQLPSISEGFKTLGDFKRNRVYMDFEIEETHQKLGRIVIELYNDHVKKTADNFMALCKGFKTEDKEVLTYANCPVHKVIKNKYMICGDIQYGNGKGGRCTLPEGFVPQENFNLKHTKAGVLSMVPVNGMVTSQFMISFDEMPMYDGVQVVFGKVIHGADILFKLNDFGTKYGKPALKLIISKCGIKRTSYITQVVCQ